MNMNPRMQTFTEFFSLFLLFSLLNLQEFQSNVMAYFNPQNVRVLVISEINRVFTEEKNQLTEILRQRCLPAVAVQRTNINITDGEDGGDIEIRIKNDITMEHIRVPVQNIRNFAQKVEAAEIARQELNSGRYLHVSLQKFKFTIKY